MNRKEFVNQLYDLIAQNTEEPHKPLNPDDFADCYCNISEDGNNDYIYIELDNCKVGGGKFIINIQAVAE